MSADTIAVNYGPRWRVHVALLMKEMLENNPGMECFKQPLMILDELLREVAARAIELDDPVLTRLMCQLTLFSVADPLSPDYDAAVVKEIIYAQA